MKTCPRDIAVSQPLALPPIAADCHQNDLLVAHADRLCQPINLGLTEMGGENLAALGQSLSWNDQHQAPARLKPAARVAEEDLFHALVLPRSELAVVRWVEVQQRKALNRAVCVECVTLQNITDSLPGLFGAIKIKLDAVAKHRRFARQCRERYAVTHTRIDCGTGVLRKSQKPSNPFCLGGGRG
jgi:hypothetical protein